MERVRRKNYHIKHAFDCKMYLNLKDFQAWGRKSPFEGSVIWWRYFEEFIYIFCSCISLIEENKKTKLPEHSGERKCVDKLEKVHWNIYIVGRWLVRTCRKTQVAQAGALTTWGGRDGFGGRRKVQEEGTCMLIADSCCCMAKPTRYLCKTIIIQFKKKSDSLPKHTFSVYLGNTED